MLVCAIHAVVHTHPEHGAVIQDPNDVFELADATAASLMAVKPHPVVRKATKDEATLHGVHGAPTPKSWEPADPRRAAAQSAAAAASAAAVSSLAGEAFKEAVAAAVKAELAAQKAGAKGKGKADADLIG